MKQQKDFACCKKLYSQELAGIVDVEVVTLGTGWTWCMSIGAAAASATRCCCATVSSSAGQGSAVKELPCVYPPQCLMQRHQQRHGGPHQGLGHVRTLSLSSEPSTDTSCLSGPTFAHMTPVSGPPGQIVPPQ